MSWSLSIQPVLKSDFAHAVGAAIAGGQPADTPGLAEDVAAAKAALLLLAGRVKKDLVGGNASGHCAVPEEFATHHDGISVSVYGS